MAAKLRQLVAAPAFEDEDTTRLAGVLNTILLASVIMTLTASVFSLLAVPDRALGVIFTITLLALEWGAWVLMRRGWIRLTCTLLVTALLDFLDRNPFVDSGT